MNSLRDAADGTKKRVLVRVHPRYVRLRQGSEIRYSLKLSRPVSKGKAVTIHVCVIMNKCGVSVCPQQLVVTASDWKLPREVVVTSDVDSELRTIQIHHKILASHDSDNDDNYNASAQLPSVFVSVLQKEATFLFAFGCGLHGRLGSNDDENATVPTPFASKWLHPVQIASGKAHSAIIDVYSNVYCFGLGANGQLGQGDRLVDASRLPLRVPTVGTSTILQVACGSHHTMCMTTEGRVFAWGDNTSGQLGLGTATLKPRGVPTRIEKLVNVRTIVCGGNHSFIILLDNNVLATGSNIAGQLGVGDRKDRAAFERIPFFRKLYAPPSALLSLTSLLSGGASDSARPSTTIGDVELACGLYHSIALCGTRVYSWGNGDDGRLGHNSIETMLEPTLVTALQHVPVRAIACGGSHSGAIAASDDVFVWGNGTHGQLGTGALRSRRVPTKLQTLHHKHVTQLAFGEWHSLALCEDSVLYAWGFGEEGQLGIPDARVVLLPTIVHALTGTGATMVRCGGSHTFVVSVLEARSRPKQQPLLLARGSTPHSSDERIAAAPQLPTRPRECDRITALARPTTASRLRDTARKLSTTQSVATATATATVPIKRPTSAVKRAPTMERLRSAGSLSARRDAIEPAPPLRVAIDTFAWRTRPMTSRTAVRNALRQEEKALSEWRDTLGPLPIRTQAASTAFISPRLRRLHDQVRQRSSNNNNNNNVEARAASLSSESDAWSDDDDAIQEHVVWQQRSRA